jgi:hypothetical protein
MVPLGISANGAHLPLGNIKTNTAEPDPFLDPQDAAREGLGILL